MKTDFKKIIAGVLIPSILLPSCTKSNFFSNEDVNGINAKYNEDATSSVAVKMDDLTAIEYQQFAELVAKLIKDIIMNPAIASEYINSPISIIKKYQLDKFDYFIDEELYSLVAKFADEDIYNAVVANDAELFFKICVDKGIIKDVDANALLNAIPTDPVIEPQASAALVAAAAVFVLVFAGTAVLAANETAVYNHRFFWNSDSAAPTNSLILNRDKEIYYLWKSRNKDTYLLETEYCEEITNKCVEVIKEYLPNMYQTLGEDRLKEILIPNLNLF